MKILFTFLFLSGLSILNNSTYCQILNIEKSRLDKDTTNYFVGNVSGSVSMYNRSAGVRNPVNLFGYNVGADAGYISQKHSYMLINKYDYLRINDNVFLSTGFSHFRINFNHRKPFHFEAFTQYQYDNFRGLDPRLLAGGSFRYRLLYSDRLSIVLSTGLMYEYEQWAHPYLKDNFTVVGLIKSTNKAVIRYKLKSYLDWNAVFYFQSGYDRNISAFRNRLSGESNLLVKVSKRFSLKTSFSWNYEDKPIVPITPFIYSLTNGIQVNF
ncbi:MAG: DUF481 domain-containing protein [Cytophagaceae bacterium]